ncbi:cytochrome b-c1 complex subunit 7 [Phtheirospermum japonicum]|uniref:Complex III subunit VII n=1 Tax=Phtheirospermum japonicum TaxID=374723 RepID=A0A830C286_9LAMI|nr:cytochrome b-c1 complex subunit 7 [Phtheirospermum japonicum]
MASAITKWLVDPNRNPLAALHMKTITNRLKNYGLRYDDLYDPMYDLDVKEALNRLPREIVDARNQRLKRAIDLSMKHAYLPEDLQVFIYNITDIRTCVGVIRFCDRCLKN